MARMKFAGEWHYIGDDENAYRIFRQLYEAQRTGRMVHVSVFARGVTPAYALVWSPGVPVVIETTEPLATPEPNADGRFWDPDEL